MQGGKGKVERRLMSFSLSGVTSLGTEREKLLERETLGGSVDEGLKI